MLDDIDRKTQDTLDHLNVVEQNIQQMISRGDPGIREAKLYAENIWNDLLGLKVLRKLVEEAEN